MFKLDNEKGIPKNKIKTFPYIEILYQLLIKYFPRINTNILQNISNYSTNYYQKILLKE